MIRSKRYGAKAALTLVWVALIGVFAWQLYRTLAGEPAARLSDRWHRSTPLYDRHGRLLRDLPSKAGVRGRPLPLEQVGARLVAATLVAEDKRFFEHAGVDGRAIARAIGQNARHARIVSGASTVTQQLVKLLDGGGQLGPRTVEVKLRESARAQNLEQQIGKEAILEAYLNRLNYGRSLVGPDAAARGYFGVAPLQISWAQAAFLAVLPRAPSYLDPYQHPDRVLRRQQRLLGDLREQAVITEADYQRAARESVAPKPLRHSFAAPHFVRAVESAHSHHRGEVIQTTLDLELQRDVEGLIHTHVATIVGRGADNAAVLVVDNSTGEVLAYVGSRDFFDDQSAGQVDMVRARRQPGSALKPFVYARAFEAGRPAVEPLADVPTVFGDRSRGYAPANFDGAFRGPVSAREALAGSLNVPAVALAAELGAASLLSSLRAVGLSSLDQGPDTYGLALALGSGEVTLGELTAAYALLARGGRSVALRMAVEGTEQLGASVEGSQIIDSASVALVSESLSDPLARVRGLGGRLLADLGFEVALKTGTSSGYRDGWCMGYTRERTVGVWVGNADGRPMAELTGGQAAGPLFASVMKRAMADVPRRLPLWDRDLLRRASVCPLSGRPAGSACPGAVTRWVRRDPAPHGNDPARRGGGERPSCTLHRHAAPRPAALPGTAPWRCVAAGPESIAVLGAAYHDWLSSQPVGAPGRDANGVPWLSASTVPGCGFAEQPRPELRIEQPAKGSVLVLSRDAAAELQHVELRATLRGATATAVVQAVEFVLDGEVVARSNAPFAASVAIARGDHVLGVRPTDPTARVALAEARFSVR